MRTLLSLVVLASSVAVAQDLKPFQEEAKEKFEKAIAKPLKAMNDKCGTAVLVKSDFENFNKELWKGKSYPSWCEGALDGILSLCSTRPAFQKALSKKLTAVSCVFAGGIAKAKDEVAADYVAKQMKFEGGVFTFMMHPDMNNLKVNAEKVVEKALE
jgi:hypothetical protein